MSRDVLTAEQEDEILQAFEQRRQLGDKVLAERYRVSQRALYDAAERAKRRRLTLQYRNRASGLLKQGS